MGVGGTVTTGRVVVAPGRVVVVVSATVVVVVASGSTGAPGSGASGSGSEAASSGSGPSATVTVACPGAPKSASSRPLTSRWCCPSVGVQANSTMASASPPPVLASTG